MLLAMIVNVIFWFFESKTIKIFFNLWFRRRFRLITKTFFFAGIYYNFIKSVETVEVETATVTEVFKTVRCSNWVYIVVQLSTEFNFLCF